eukprot:681945-Pleurochrysis_carterae.AAC.1
MPRHPALARSDAVVLRPTPFPSPLPFVTFCVRSHAHRCAVARSFRASTCPSLLSMTCLPTLR